MIAQRRTQMTDGIHSLGSASVIVLEQPAEALAADNLAGGLADSVTGLNDLVLEPPMISFGVKMDDDEAPLATNNGSVNRLLSRSCRDQK